MGSRNVELIIETYTPIDKKFSVVKFFKNYFPLHGYDHDYGFTLTTLEHKLYSKLYYYDKIKIIISYPESDIFKIVTRLKKELQTLDISSSIQFNINL